MTSRAQSVVRTYKGNQNEATAAFQNEAPQMAERGYFPTSQNWAPGTYGCGAFLLALLLCVVFIGFLVFIYMLIVKPAGTLSVTYELRAVAPVVSSASGSDEKICPSCAETVKAAAKVCRFCRHEFS